MNMFFKMNIVINAAAIIYNHNQQIFVKYFGYESTLGSIINLFIILVLESSLYSIRAELEIKDVFNDLNTVNDTTLGEIHIY